MAKKRIKGIVFVVAILITSIVLIALTFQKKPDESMEKHFQRIYDKVQVVAFGDYMQYDYGTLFRQASVVAIVTPLDKLTEENTAGISSTGLNKYYNLHSVRKVEAVKFFKNDLDYEDCFTMAEKCGVIEGKNLVMMDACYPMEKGAYYLVFLQESGYGYPISVSADNGKFDLTNLSLNTHKEVLVDALFDLGLVDTGGHDEIAKQAVSAIQLLFGDLNETNETLAQGGKWFPQWKLYALSSYKENLGKEERDELLRRTAEWDSFELTTEYTDKAYAIKIAYSDEGAGKIYRTDRTEAYIDPADGMIFFVDGEFLA